MPVLNLRNVPEKLMRDLKAAAALEGKDFHPFCLALLEEAIVLYRRPRTARHIPPVEVNFLESFYRNSTMEPPGPPREPIRPRELVIDPQLNPAAPDPEIEIT